MFLLSFLLTTSFFAKAQPAPQLGSYQAILGEAGAFGDVEINGNSIRINLHAGGTGEPLATLTSVSYHIHQKWESTTSDWGVGSECGPSFTGGHWDPTFACGPASGDARCNAECIPKPADGGSYDCSQATYSDDWTKCEVGDLSGKFGAITLTGGNGTAEDQDNFLLPVPGSLSIVFHAPDGSRVLCGKLVSSQVAPVAQTSVVAGKLYGNLGFARVVIDYDVVPTQVTATFSGSTSGNNGDALAQIPEECKVAGAQISYHIHEKWTHGAAKGAIGGDLCGATYTGDHYDPTYGCGPATGNSKCAVAACNWGPYNCTPTTYMQSPLACEIGDLSGKFGKLVLAQDGTASLQNTDQYLPSNALHNLAVVFHCPGASRAFCVQLTTSDDVVSPALATTSPSPSIAISPSNSPDESGSFSTYGTPAWSLFMAIGVALLYPLFN